MKVEETAHRQADNPVTQAPANARKFVKTSHLDTTLDRIKQFHNDPRALAHLTPPPIIMQLHRDERRSITEGEIEFTLWFGPLPIRWIAKHQAGPTADSFADQQLKGPLAFWRHEHIYTASDDGGVTLTDSVTLAHKRGLAGLLTRLAFDGMLLRLLFAYRHWRTRRALTSR